MRFAHFDHAGPEPAPVLGWYDTDAADYHTLPPEQDRLPLSDQQWDRRMDHSFGVNGGELVALPRPAPAPRPWAVPRRLVLERVTAAGQLRPLRAALRLDADVDGLSDPELLLRDHWLASTYFQNDDDRVRVLIRSVGLDPDVILSTFEAS